MGININFLVSVQILWFIFIFAISDDSCSSDEDSLPNISYTSRRIKRKVTKGNLYMPWQMVAKTAAKPKVMASESLKCLIISNS